MFFEQNFLNLLFGDPFIKLKIVLWLISLDETDLSVSCDTKYINTNNSLFLGKLKEVNSLKLRNPDVKY